MLVIVSKNAHCSIKFKCLCFCTLVKNGNETRTRQTLIYFCMLQALFDFQLDLKCTLLSFEKRK